MIFSMGQPGQAVYNPLNRNPVISSAFTGFAGTFNTVLIALWFKIMDDGADLFFDSGVISLSMLHSSGQRNGGEIDVSLNNAFGPFGIPITPTESGWHSFAFSAQLVPDNSFTQIGLQAVLDLKFYEIMNPAFADPFILFPGPVNLWFAGCAIYSFRWGIGETAFDLSQNSNMLKLFDRNNHPIDWGTHGGNVTGVDPQIYLTGDHTQFLTNRGSGENFTCDHQLIDVPKPT